jgi:hypothetical protein
MKSEFVSGFSGKVNFYVPSKSGEREGGGTRKKILSFKELEDGWQYGEGEAPTEKVLGIALRIYEIGHMLGLKSDAFPSPNGNVTVEFYRGGESIEITVYDDKTIDLSIERGKGFDFEEVEYVEGVEMATLVGILRNFAGVTKRPSIRCSLSGSSILDIMLSTKGDLGATVFQTIKEGSHWSILSASESERKRPTLMSATT